MKRLIMLVVLMSLLVGLVGTVNAVDITLWGFPRWEAEGQEAMYYEREVAAEFMGLYPQVNIKVEMIPYDGGAQKLAVAIASDTTPDILIDSDARLLSYAKMGRLIPFELTEYEEEVIYQGAIDIMTIDDSLYVYPFGCYVSAWTVNKQIAEKSGALHLLPEDRLWTTTQAEAFLEAIKPYTIPLGFGVQNEQGDDRVRLIMQTFGAKFIEDGKLGFDSEEAIAGMEWLTSLHEKGLTVRHPGNTLATTANQKFQAGEIGVTIYGGSAFLMQEDGENITMMMSSPFPEGGSPAHVMATLGMGVFDNNNTEQAEWAQKFVRYFVEERGKEALQKMNWFPMRSDFGIMYDNEEMQVLDGFVQYATYRGTDIDNYQQIRALFYPELQAMFIGMKTPTEALTDWVSQANKLLK